MHEREIFNDQLVEKVEEVVQFSGLQKGILNTPKVPEEITDSDSTISLFKVKEVVNGILEAKNRLVMETNA